MHGCFSRSDPGIDPLDLADGILGSHPLTTGLVQGRLGGHMLGAGGY